VGVKCSVFAQVDGLGNTFEDSIDPNITAASVFVLEEYAA